MHYQFVINGQPSESHDEQAIRQLIELRVIGPETLAWREAMDAWQPAWKIDDLAPFFPGRTTPAGPTSPPPVPAQIVGDADGSGASELRRERASVPPSPSVSNQPSQLEAGAHKFVHWFFRPWNGRRSRVADYVDRNPQGAIPVALALAVGMFLLFGLAVSPFVAENEGSRPPLGNSGQFPPTTPQAGGGGFSMRNWGIMQNAQNETDNIINDTYRYQRDSFDRQSDTYRDATYDWHHSNND